MRVFMAGATGVIGRRAIPLLIAAGHRVTGVARTPAKRQQLNIGATRLKPARVPVKTKIFVAR